MSIGSALENLLPAKARLTLYVIVFFALATLTAYTAAEGDYLVAAITLLGTLQSALAAGNVTTTPPQEYTSVDDCD